MCGAATIELSKIGTFLGCLETPEGLEHLLLSGLKSVLIPSLGEKVSTIREGGAARLCAHRRAVR
jgi:hypothetical protein